MFYTENNLMSSYHFIDGKINSTQIINETVCIKDPS